MVLGSEEKSDKRSRCRGKFVRNVRKKLSNLVGMYSGADRLGAKGRLVYILRIVDDELRSFGRGGG